MTTQYPEETLDDMDDDGTMVDSKSELSEALIGRRIVHVEQDVPVEYKSWPGSKYMTSGTADLVLTLDNGKKVRMIGQSDCCAFTEVNEFMVSPDLVEHAITGVATEDDYTTWHILADKGDMMKLSVGWSCGNPFYYAYGFKIDVVDA